MTEESSFIDLAELKTEGGAIPFDRSSGSMNEPEPDIVPVGPVNRLAFALCDAIGGVWPYETPYRCVELAEKMISKRLVFDADRLDVSQTPNRGL